MAGAFEAHHHLAHFRGLALFEHELRYRAAELRGNFHGGLIRHDFEHDLVFLNDIARLHVPLDDFAFHHAFAEVGDRVTVEPADRLSLSVSGPFGAGLAAEPDNLILRALRALGQATGTGEPPLRVTLDKRLPIAAGLGGGSSDAGAALKLARQALALDGQLARAHLAQAMAWSGRKRTDDALADDAKRE